MTIMENVITVIVVLAAVGIAAWKFGLLDKWLKKEPAVAADPPKPAEPVPSVPHVPTISRPLTQFELLVAQRDPQLSLMDITQRIGRGLTADELAFARRAGVPGAEPIEQPKPAGISVDRHNLRSLSGDQGNLGILEGPAGTGAWFTVHEPAGTRVKILTGMTQSALGACHVVEIMGPGREYTKGSFQALADIEFIATGEIQLVRVVLGEPGAVAVQRN